MYWTCIFCRGYLDSVGNNHNHITERVLVLIKSVRRTFCSIIMCVATNRCFIDNVLVLLVDEPLVCASSYKNMKYLASSFQVKFATQLCCIYVTNAVPQVCLKDEGRPASWSVIPVIGRFGDDAGGGCHCWKSTWFMRSIPNQFFLNPLHIL